MDDLPSDCADILEMELPISNEQRFGDGDCLTDNIAIVQDSQEREDEGHSDLTYSGSTREDSDTTTSGQVSSAVLCPCYDEGMTVEHECNSGTGQPDELSASYNDATQIHATSQPNPDPPDRNYEGIIVVFTVITNQMNQQILKDLFPKT